MHSPTRIWGIGFGASLLFLLALLVYGPVNIEQYHHSYPASLAFFSNLLEGRYLFWYDGFGLGTPLPLGENFNFHPLFLLTVFLPLRLVLSIFWLSHLTLGSVYCLRLYRRLEIAPSVRLCLLFSYVFSIATVNYSYMNDWPAVFLAWTTYPILVFYLDCFIENGQREGPWFGAARLALLFGFTVLNTHPGYLVVLCMPLVLFVLVTCWQRPRVIAWLCLTAAAILCLTSERCYFILSEALRFPDEVTRVSQNPYSAEDWLAGLIHPLSSNLIGATAELDARKIGDEYFVPPTRLRLPFIGLVASLAAAITAFYLMVPSRRRSGAARELTLQQACAACFLFSIVASLLPSRYILNIHSGSWLFRDPAIFFGLLVAGRGLTHWHSASAGKKVWVKSILALQCAQVLLGVLPGLLVVYRYREINTQFYSGRHEAAFAAWLAEKSRGLGARLYLSPRIANDLMSEEALYASVGLLGTGDFDRMGLEPVNGYFKGISMDAIYPSLFLMMGMIASDPTVIRNPPMFDVLGIEYLMILEDEIAEIGPDHLRHLQRIGSFSAPELREPLILMWNPNAWPRAVLFPPEIADLTLDEMGCRAPAALLLCSDFSAFERLRLEGRVRSEGRDGARLLVMEPAGRDRVVLLSTNYRSEWRALDEHGHELRTMAIAKALLGVEVPAGTGTVSVSFEPRWRQRLLLLELATTLGCAAIIARRGTKTVNSASGARRRR